MAVDEKLACGRDLETVWEGLGREPDAHEQTCETCQAARASMSKVQHATVELRERNDDPELQPSPSLAVAIKGLARTQVRRDRTFVVATHDDGDITASEWAVVQTVRRVLEPISELLVERVRIQTTPGGGLVVTVQIILRIGASAPRVADEARELVLPALTEQLAQAIDRVDVEVRDVREQ